MITHNTINNGQIDDLESNQDTVLNMAEITSEISENESETEISETEDISHDCEQYEGFSSKDELIQHKKEMLLRLYSLQQMGVVLSQEYDLTSNFKSMKSEYDGKFDENKEENRKKHGVQIFKSALLGGSYFIELLNNHYDPFGINLNELTHKLTDSLTDQDELLEELYEKYLKNIEMTPVSPEAKLAIIIGTIMMKCYAVNSMKQQFSEQCRINKQVPTMYQNSVQSQQPTLYQNIIVYITNFIANVRSILNTSTLYKNMILYLVKMIIIIRYTLWNLFSFIC